MEDLPKDLPKELRQFDWYDTESHYLVMEFQSDSSIPKRGFLFEIICKRPNAQFDFVDVSGRRKNPDITNDQNIGKKIQKYA